MSQIGDDGEVGRKVPCGMESQEGRSRATLNHGEDGKLHNHCSSADVTTRDTNTLFIGFSHVTFPTHPSYS